MKQIITIEHLQCQNEKLYLNYSQDAFESYLYTIDRKNNFKQEKVIDFTKNELNDEVWRNIKEWMPLEYKQYMNKDSRNLKLYECDKYYVSNLGRIAKLKDDNELHLLSIINYKDHYSLIKFNNITYCVHRLVGYMFVPNDNIKYKTIINHKGLKQKYNNRASFLEWCNNTHNSNNDIVKNTDYSHINRKDSQKIKCINLINNSEILYDSLYSAAQNLNCSHSLISFYCMNQKIYTDSNGIKYKFEYETNSPGRTIYPWEPVVQLNNDTNEFIKLFITLNELRDCKIDTVSHILDTCRKNRKANDYMHGCKLFKWMYLRDFNKLNNNQIKLLFHDKFVSLTGNNKLVKIYETIYDFIDLNFDLNAILKMCNDSDKTLQTSNKYITTTLSNHQKVYRKWLFLNDYLKYLKIDSIDEIDIKDKFTRVIPENDILGNDD